MNVDHSRCVGCGNCVYVCPMGAIYIENYLANINQDECVECGACKRFVTPEDMSPGIVRALRRTLERIRLRYDQPIDICPTAALYQDELTWPRVLRAAFSDPTVTHPGTGVAGRGTEEIKTNDVTGRLQPGWAGVLVEFGRPGVGARFYDVEKISTALAEVEGIHFEEKNPVTQLMTDTTTGQLNSEVLQEKFLSCILEVLVPLERVPTALETVERIAPSLDTVISLTINGRCGPNGEIPYADAVAQTSFTLSPNGKNNLGLGRANLVAAAEGSHAS